MKSSFFFPRSGAVKYPAPVSPVLAWFVRGWTDVPEIAEGLRSTLFRRMSSLVAVVLATLSFIFVAVIRHPQGVILAWAIVGGSLEMGRLVVIGSIVHALKTNSLSRKRVLVDLLVLGSIVWSAEIGMGACFSIFYGDFVLTAFSIVLAVGVVGAVSARNPGSPRLSVTQMILIIGPLTIGLFSNDDPAVRLLTLMVPCYLIGMITITAQLHRDYVDMLTAQHENRRRALQCGLTGLANAMSFHECLGEAMAELGDPSIAVLALDLDGFKGVNDRYGHPVGDELLKMVAVRLRALESPTVTMARIGGDEFAVLLRGDDSDVAERLAEQLIRDIAIPYRLSEGIAVIAASIGIARRSGGGRDAVALYARADRALYRAKAAGKGTWRRDDVASEAGAEKGDRTLRMPAAGPANKIEPRAA